MIRSVRATLALTAFAFGRLLGAGRTLIAVALLIVLLLFVVLLGLRHTWSAEEFGTHVVAGMVALFYLPIVGLLFGTSSFAEFRDDGMLQYLLARPVPRPLIPLVFFAASAPFVLVFAVGGLFALATAASVLGRPEVAEAFAAYAPAIGAGALAYTAVFQCVAALWRHATVIGFAYVFFVEVFVGNVPGFLKQLSVSYYVRAGLIDAGSAWLDAPPARVFAPLSVVAAVTALLSIAVGGLVAGAAAAAWREDPNAAR